MSDKNADAAVDGAGGDPTTPAKFFLEAPLYSRIKPTSSFLKTLRYTGFQFDAHCVECGKEAPFNTAEVYIRRAPPSLASQIGTGSVPKSEWEAAGIFNISATCARKPSHTYTCFFRMMPDGSLRKIGQDPSREDVAGADVRRFRSVLKSEWMRELNRATGLASHGIGIGSFVYLRRIFEGLIQEHYSLMVERKGEVEGFGTLRMNEKVSVLAEVLPPLLVEHSATYSILSKGIHELDEETCLEYFPVIRRSIIMILDQDLEARRAVQEAKNLKSDLDKIAGKLRQEKNQTTTDV